MLYRKQIPVGLPSWPLIEDAVKARIEDLREEASSLSATDRSRFEASVRIDELRALLASPVEAQSASVGVIKNPPSETY